MVCELYVCLSQTVNVCMCNTRLIHVLPCGVLTSILKANVSWCNLVAETVLHDLFASSGSVCLGVKIMMHPHYNFQVIFVKLGWREQKEHN